MKESAWYYDAVEFACKNKLFQGTGADKFEPRGKMTRGMFVTVLYNMADRPAVDTGGTEYKDVSGKSYYHDSIAWATQNGVANGVGGGKFMPNEPITREQMVTMLWNFIGKNAANVTLDGFSDSGKVSSWATEALKWAIENGIVNGRGNGVLDPTGTTVRAEAATILMNYLLSDK